LRSRADFELGLLSRLRFLVGKFFRSVLAKSSSCSSLIDLAICREAPLSDERDRSPRFAASAAPAAICWFLDFAGIPQFRSAGDERFSSVEKSDQSATGERNESMKVLFLRRIIWAGIAGCLLLTGALNGAGQTTERQLSKEQADLEKKRAELERKSAELQQREAALQQAQQQLADQQSGRSLSMNLSGDVLFDYDKAVLKPAAEEALKKVAVVLSQFPDSMVTVEGYTDSKGGKPFNMQLSQERAMAVKDWLVKNGSIPAASITAKGFGEDNPVAPNKNADGSDNPAGRALNRRVSIIVEKPPAAIPAATPSLTTTPY
jgi:outer membrane protein OmpA-like peptidoglycan-associated protein